MKERRIEIIDRTIIVLKDIYGDKLIDKIPKVKELIKLLYIIGSDFIEITQELYEELSPLPRDVEYKISNSTVIQMKDNINPYSTLNKEGFVSDSNNLRIVGLEDVIFYDYKEILEEIKSEAKEKNFI